MHLSNSEEMDFPWGHSVIDLPLCQSAIYFQFRLCPVFVIRPSIKTPFFSDGVSGDLDIVIALPWYDWTKHASILYLQNQVSFYRLK